MESPVDDNNIIITSKMLNYENKSNLECSFEQKEQKYIHNSNDRMTNSAGSILDDTTPSDSGVQLLDSESSELNESLISSTGFDFDNPQAAFNNKSSLPDLVPSQKDEFSAESPINVLTKSDIVNSNICDNDNQMQQQSQNIFPDDLISSTHSTFDTENTENIVYRRRAKKTKTHSTAPKKRVSFHEDILKNTKTDNIHIEHGFITYKSYPRKNPQVGRYSWCSEGDKEDFNENNHHVYRNACSDVLDYGKPIDIYENTTSNYIHYDNSGVFEYGPQQYKNGDNLNNKNNKDDFYKCNCSDSNSSLDSGSSQSDETGNYAQAKSNSCDCIGISSHNSNNNSVITENCYYSEPSIEILDERIKINNKNPKSVWSKDKKPKSSCLKKSKRHTDILVECNLNTKVKKFNVHPLTDMNNLIDNSKMIFGSLKNIFSIPLPERGVPEGSEDLQSVCECIPENESSNQSSKSRAFLSKSLDGGFKDIKDKINFVHNVDEQLRRKNDEDLFAPTRQNSRDFVIVSNDTDDSDDDDNDANNDINNENDIKNNVDDIDGNINKKPTEMDEEENNKKIPNDIQSNSGNYRNKFIINCESTVFEHTGVSYCYDKNKPNEIPLNSPIVVQQNSTENLQATPKVSSFSAGPFKQKLSNIFKNLKEPNTDAQAKEKIKSGERLMNKVGVGSAVASSVGQTSNLSSPRESQKTSPNLMEISFTSSCSDKESTISDMTTTTTTTTTTGAHDQMYPKNKLLLGGGSSNGNNPSPRKNRHLSSPLKKQMTTRYERARMSPDLFNNPLLCRDTSKNTILSDEFDDILTITTTDTDKNTESDMVIVDYSSCTQITNDKLDNSNNFLKPATSKTSLINRFLRNVTQKKIIDASIKKSNLFATKVKSDKKLFENLYVKNMKIQDKDGIIADFNAEIAMEIEMSTSTNNLIKSSDDIKKNLIKNDFTIKQQRFEFGVGEVSIDIFNGNYLHILRGADEILMKAFKLYTGYSREGYMTPVLVFLTDKTLYVADLVRNRLCNKFVLPYSDLDVILMGPYGNTVLLSNGSRDMQQVLLAGGSYPAEGLVSSLELCARRGGSTLPAVGHLNLDHLTPLQVFVRDNSSVSKHDPWMYYAVVNVPSGTLNSSPEPMGPHIKGPLMHRNIKGNENPLQWQPGYFLLKAGVIYLFQDAGQKIPTWAITLSECQGARRTMTAGRPHCFEIFLKTGRLQLAAPDEYVASEWLQSLVQSASGLFELQEKHLTLGCTLVMTSNHLITLREDFTAPLRRVNKISSPLKENIDPNMKRHMSNSSILDTTSEISSVTSNASTPTLNMDKRTNSNMSTPTKQKNLQYSCFDEKSFTSMSSYYGKNSGVEILTCAAIDEMVAIRIPAETDNWWCILEFSCQEVRENSDDLVIFFATNSEMQRFLTMLEKLWNSKNLSNTNYFPISIVSDDDFIGKHCDKLFSELNKSWEPILSAALGFPQ